MVNSTKITAFVNALKSNFVKTSDRKTDISGDFSSDTTSVPTAKAVKDEIIAKMAEVSNLVLGETSTTAYRGDRGKTAYDHSQVTTGNPHNVTKSDVGLSNVTNVAQAPATHTTDSEAHSDLFAEKANAEDVPTKFTDLTDDSGFDSRLDTLESTITGKADTSSVTSELAKKTVTVEKQETAETGFISTYVIKQNGTQVGSKINIPKDYLVKSATMGTCATANSPVNGYVVGDKYLDFVINTKDNDSVDNHIYIKVSDLVDTYTVGDTTTVDLTLTNNNITAKVVDGSIGTTQLSSTVNGILNSIPDDTNDLTNGAGFITSSGADSEIDAYIDAVVTALSS